MTGAVFFDRDGVLNRAVVRDGKPYPPASASEVRLETGVIPALLRLKEQVPLLFVFSNQPDVARGGCSRREVEAINDVIAQQLPIERFYMCYHDDADACRCRKPLPGLLEIAAREYTLDLRSCFAIGDRWRDVDAGAAAGCTTILIDRGYRERRPLHRPNFVFRTITDAVDLILSRVPKGEVHEVSA